MYLTGCYPGAYTCDNFQDVAALKLEPHFADYVREAFKPLGVYLNFWQPEAPANSVRRSSVMMVKDAYAPSKGKLALTLDRAEEQVTRQDVAFALPGLGQQTYVIDLQMPHTAGLCTSKAAAYAEGQSEPTVSRRRVTIQASGK